jgi:hypothetical protein
VLIEPRTTAEFRALVLKAINIENAPDPTMLLAALDEIVHVIEQVYAGEQVIPTPCQLFVGRMFLDIVLELLAEGPHED